jgi:hypothetical protein
MLYLFWTACRFGPALGEFDDLSWFADQTGESCSLSPALALGGDYLERRAVGGIAADGDVLYVALTGPDDTWLFAVDGATGETLGQLPLPGLEFAADVEATGGLVYVVTDAPRPEAHLIDASDPAAMALVGQAALGRGGDASNFAAWGDRVYTDGGDTLYLDLTGTPTAVSADPAELLGAPLVVGDELLATVPDGPGCALHVFDPAGPTSLAAVDTGGACLSSAMTLQPDGSVLGYGWRTEGDGVASVAQRLVRGEGGWTAEATLDLPLDLDAAAGAFVIGEGGPLDMRGGLTVGRSPLAVQQTWWPDTYFRSNVWFFDVAVTGDRAWVAASVESGEFDGVVALEPGRCP